ncbi:MaoC family dehydratase, partial [Candidatus Bathyarchaeota archaeon]|nr:MaoC family dehydratase [Candidatus Bathyarchaeota archaeon]
MTEEPKAKTIQDFVEDSRKLVGWPSSHAGPDWIKEYQVKKSGVIRVDEAQDFSLAMGDDNPLYLDPKYGRHTRYGTMITHPSFVACVRYNIWRGASGYGDYRAVSLV